MYRLKKCGELTPVCAAESKAFRLGIGFEKLDRAVFDPARAYDKLAAIGVKWVRIQSGWARTEKTRGVYDFAWLDDIVDNLIRRGLSPWMCVCYGNGRYTDLAKEMFGAVGCPPVKTPEEREAWARYCTALAAHFAGRVTLFEIWNEPDLAYSWKHGVSATEYGKFTKETGRALRAGNPDCYRIGGVTNGDPTRYLNEALKTGMGTELEALSFHAYTYNDREAAQKTRVLRGLCRLYAPHLEIIQGESGGQSRAGGHGAMHAGAWTERKQAKYLLRHIVTDLGAGVKFTSHFTCVDMIEALNGKVGDRASYLDYGYFGVLAADFDENGFSTGDYSPKPSYHALRHLASLFNGDFSAVPLPVSVCPDTAMHLGKKPTVSFEGADTYGFASSDTAMFVYWKPSDIMTDEYEGAITLTAADLGARVRLVDPMDGAIYEIPDAMCERDAFGGVKFTCLPIRDYPLFLIFDHGGTKL